MEKRDIVIVGGGPAGLKAAETLANAGRDVLVLEQKKVIGDKVCAGGITIKDFELGIPQKIVDRKFKRAVIHTPLQETAIKDNKFFGATVDRKVLGKWMASQAKKAGAEIRKETKEISDKLNVKSYSKIKTSKSETLFPDNLKSWKTTTPGTTPQVITSVIESKCLPKFVTEFKALAEKPSRKSKKFLKSSSAHAVFRFRRNQGYIRDLLKILYKSMYLDFQINIGVAPPLKYKKYKNGLDKTIHCI